MKLLLKRRIALAVAAVALLVGGTAVALGATGSHKAHTHRGHGTLSVAASYLGISRAQLSSDLRSGESLAQVAGTTPGHSEAGLVAALVAAQHARLNARSAKLPQRVAALVQKPGTSLARGARRRSSLRAVALSYMGLERKQLAQELATGKSIAQIADSTSGKSANGLIEAIEAHAKQRLQSAVKAGRLSAAQANERQSALLARITGLVDRVHTARSHKQR